LITFIFKYTQTKTIFVNFLLLFKYLYNNNHCFQESIKYLDQLNN